LLLASTIPACQAYDPAFAYEVAAIVQNGLHRMYGDKPEDIFFYITLYNENYQMPAKPATASIDSDILGGLYKWQERAAGKHAASIIFSGSSHLAAREAANELQQHFDVGVDLWSATSYKLLREEAMEVERWNRLHPTSTPKVSRVASLLGESSAPIVAVSDFMKAIPDQISRYVTNRPFAVLGTDGMGRSDTREALRRHFEIDAPHIVVSVLYQLALAGSIPATAVEQAIKKYGLKPESVSALHA
jgi:pyruvate dehydrogenase E1 component